MIVHVFDDHLFRVPSIRVPFRRRVVVMARDHYVAVPLRLGGREDGVEDGDGAPVTEKVALLESCPRMLTEVECVIWTFYEVEIRISLAALKI